MVNARVGLISSLVSIATYREDIHQRRKAGRVGIGAAGGVKHKIDGRIALVGR
jgi:hypothetical protein